MDDLVQNHRPKRRLSLARGWKIDARRSYKRVKTPKLLRIMRYLYDENEKFVLKGFTLIHNTTYSLMSWLFMVPTWIRNCYLQNNSFTAIKFKRGYPIYCPCLKILNYFLTLWVSIHLKKKRKKSINLQLPN